MILAQILESLSLGVVVLDSELNVSHWNRWMVLHSGITSESILGKSILEFFPNLNNPRFLRSCKAVLAFGNFTFFSQKLHRYLFPFKPVSSFGADIDYMQQSCVMGPLRDENNSINHLYITIQDVTEVVAYERRLLEMNMEDSLTGAYNRRFLDVFVQREFERHKRYATPFSVIMMDIDFFKAVNDEYGHQCGDFLLKGIAAEIAGSIRKVDFLARYGGEEFCCLLPETTLPKAVFVAERIRKNIAQKEFEYDGNKIKLTISAGVTTLRGGIDSVEGLIGKADEALYTAKRQGRNKVISVE
jgi:diguanylate cyclase (GGDEF)-like protein